MTIDSASLATGAAATARADAMQAAYFRLSLSDERQSLLLDLARRNAEITRRIQGGQLSAVGRIRSQIRSVEAELRYLDGLIDRLNSRFAPDGEQRI